MSNLKYLVDEIRAGLEIYYSSLTGGQYLKTAFILCDDYSELLSKLFLIRHDHNWSDKRPNGSFKKYSDVLTEVETFFDNNRPDELPTLKSILERMNNRRKRRNGLLP